MTTSEANGRISIFLSTASWFVLALAFIGQSSGLGRTFYLFSFVLLPTLFLIGALTYIRVLQTGIEDLLVTRAMARIRRYFIDLDPEVSPYYLLLGNDDHIGHLRNMGIYQTGPQLAFTAATMVALLDCVVAGVFTALVVTALGFPAHMSAVAGIVLGLVATAAFLAHEAGQWRRAELLTPALFPSGEDER